MANQLSTCVAILLVLAILDQIQWTHSVKYTKYYTSSSSSCPFCNVFPGAYGSSPSFDEFQANIYRIRLQAMQNYFNRINSMSSPTWPPTPYGSSNQYSNTGNYYPPQLPPQAPQPYMNNFPTPYPSPSYPSNTNNIYPPGAQPNYAPPINQQPTGTMVPYQGTNQPLLPGQIPGYQPQIPTNIPPQVQPGQFINNPSVQIPTAANPFVPNAYPPVTPNPVGYQQPFSTMPPYQGTNQPLALPGQIPAYQQQIPPQMQPAQHINNPLLSPPGATNPFSNSNPVYPQGMQPNYPGQQLPPGTGMPYPGMPQPTQQPYPNGSPSPLPSSANSPSTAIPYAFPPQMQPNHAIPNSGGQQQPTGQSLPPSAQGQQTAIPPQSTPPANGPPSSAVPFAYPPTTQPNPGKPNSGVQQQAPGPQLANQPVLPPGQGQQNPTQQTPQQSNVPQQSIQQQQNGNNPLNSPSTTNPSSNSIPYAYPPGMQQNFAPPNFPPNQQPAGTAVPYQVNQPPQNQGYWPYSPQNGFPSSAPPVSTGPQGYPPAGVPYTNSQH